MSKKLLTAGLRLTTYLTSRLTTKYDPGGSYYTSYTVNVQRPTTVYDIWYTSRVTWDVIVGSGGTLYNTNFRATYYYSYGPKEFITAYQSYTQILTTYDPYYYDDYTYYTVQKYTTW
ncbi:hypothetical protein [Caulobacter phage Cr30]|uniref:hypothetical protein n=1 Tax=Caulobacter phage Cr30 TaxID=1357714 RepID=UPI0004A9B5C5|nr:hypothetical protein OZ74_gp254 [Caulobacter phage Cr30]AGS81089.1 hypothetical protein [Caulobacter phage Cr30]